MTYRWSCLNCGAHSVTKGGHPTGACSTCGSARGAWMLLGSDGTYGDHTPLPGSPLADAMGQEEFDASKPLPRTPDGDELPLSALACPLRLAYPPYTEGPLDVRPFGIPDPDPFWVSTEVEGVFVERLLPPPVHPSCLDAMEAGIETAEWFANGGEWENE